MGDAVLSRRDPGTVFYPKPAGTIAVGGKRAEENPSPAERQEFN
jgi:hypothetical protein